MEQELVLEALEWLLLLLVAVEGELRVCQEVQVSVEVLEAHQHVLSNDQPNEEVFQIVGHHQCNTNDHSESEIHMRVIK